MHGEPRALARAAALTTLFALGGCAAMFPEQPVVLERFRPTGLQGPPRLAVMISRNDLCAVDPATQTESCVAQEVTARQSEWFLHCLAGGFRGSNYEPDLRSLDTDVSLREALAHLRTAQLLAGDVVVSLAEAGALARLGHEGVSHVVAFALKTTPNYRSKSDMELSGSGGAVGIAGGKMHYFRVEFSGSIIDVPAAALAGRAMTAAEGGSGMGGGVIFVPIPIPFIFPMWSNVDAKGDSCEALASAIAKFLYSTAQPDPGAPGS